jgi:hypothetical protein
MLGEGLEDLDLSDLPLECRSGWALNDLRKGRVAVSIQSVETGGCSSASISRSCSVSRTEASGAKREVPNQVS